MFNVESLMLNVERQGLFAVLNARPEVVSGALIVIGEVIAVGIVIELQVIQ